MREEPLDRIGHAVPMMRLLVEGALALFEDEWDENPQATADMMGHALYSLRVHVKACQEALEELAKEAP